MISVHFQGKTFNITVTQVYAPATNDNEGEWFYEDVQALLELTPKIDVLFITEGFPGGSDLFITEGFPGGSDGKASAHKVGDPGSIPRLGRSLGKGNGNPLQYSCLENSMDGGGWWAKVHGVAKS